ncbi:unnamed protein product [Mycena citricolor]|uniref:Chitin-binding type-3 domain-containing protein n=1 Tax=Mycena citricolor TaxID=2018698 RepID=A0AAD2K6D2_9AGAR|nr:unnamed protein product [Mycena citricolor]
MQYWEPGVYYESGSVVEYEGHRYRIIQPHTSQSDWTPPVTQALWGRLQDGDHGGEHRQHEEHRHHEEEHRHHEEEHRQQNYGGEYRHDEKQSSFQAPPDGQEVQIHHEEREKHWYDLDDKRKQELEVGGGLLAGAALLAGGYAAWKGHEKSQEEENAHKWSLQNWVHDAEVRAEKFRNYGPQSPATWVLNRGKNIPQGAIAVGQEHSWTLYICRAYHEGGILIGKASDAFKKGAVIGYRHEEVHLDIYEILLGDMNGLRWVPAQGRLNVASLGFRPVEGGKEASGTPLYIAEAPYNGAVHPGKASEDLDGAYIPYDGTEKCVKLIAADSVVGRWFRLEGSGHPKERIGSRFTTEIRAGLTTWAAMAYIISVNAAILADSGATCVCPTPDHCPNGSNPEYDVCLGEVRNDLIISTAAVAALASFLMGFLANLPVGMAPGLGLNAYFAYSIVGYHGQHKTTYQEALAAVFLEGWIFLFLSIIGLRQWIVRIMPQSLVLAVGAGIGLFIALSALLRFIGLSNGGLKVIGGDITNYVGLGGCKPEDMLPALPGFCAGGQLRSPTMWLGIFLGGILTVLLMLYRVRGAILIGIFLTSIVSWPRSTAVTYFPHTPAGDAAFDYFKQIVHFRPLQKIGNVIDYHYGQGRVWYALITMLYVDILDTTGTLYSMAKFAGLRDPVTMDFENSTIAYCVDAFAISMGALMGSSPVTAFIESATGISEGGKTGITAMVTGLCFFVSVFFAPIFASIPSWATGGALIIVGSLMIRNVRDVNWDYIGDAVPAFLTIIIIPLSYNIAYGVIAGILSYILLNGIPWIIARLSGNRILPPNIDMSEEWSIPPGSIIPFWMRKLVGMVDEQPEDSTGVQLEVRGQSASNDTDARSEKTDEASIMEPRKHRLR